MTTLPDGPWTVTSGENQGRPLFVRINTGANAVAGHATLGYRIGIAIPLNAPDTAGLPDDKEAEALARIEEATETALRIGTEAILTVVITTGGMREFMVYTGAPQHVQGAITSLQAQFPAYHIQCYVKPDNDWDAYASFADFL